MKENMKNFAMSDEELIDIDGGNWFYDLVHEAVKPFQTLAMSLTDIDK